MDTNTEEILKTMLIFFPSAEEEYQGSIKKCGTILETVVMEDIFMPRIIKILEKNEESDLLERIFMYFEKVLSYGNDKAKNLLIVTVLENLGNDKTILNAAQKYMGSKTVELQLKADKDLGRV